MHLRKCKRGCIRGSIRLTKPSLKYNHIVIYLTTTDNFKKTTTSMQTFQVYLSAVVKEGEISNNCSSGLTKKVTGR